MNTQSKLIVLALLGVACGPAKVIDEPVADSESGGSSTSSDTNTSANESDTSETDTSDSATSETGGSFVPMTEFGDDSHGCDPFFQDCPQGEKCVPYASSGDGWDANKCVAVTGDQVTGEACTYDGEQPATDDCDATGICLDRDGDMLGTCHAFCTGTADEPECLDDLLCEFYPQSVVALCVEQCDPLLQDCSAPFGCYWEDTGFHCLPGGDDMPTGEPCIYVNDCPPGNMCVEAALLPSCDGDDCCTAICELGLGENLCLLPGSECVPFFEEDAAPEGFKKVGLCLAP
jgi:hypothetical protein